MVLLPTPPFVFAQTIIMPQGWREACQLTRLFFCLLVALLAAWLAGQKTAQPAALPACFTACPLAAWLSGCIASLPHGHPAYLQTCLHVSWLTLQQRSKPDSKKESDCFAFVLYGSVTVV
jgi:hypothetical protein